MRRTRNQSEGWSTYQKAGNKLHLLISTSCLEISAHEVEGCWDGQRELEGVQHEFLHSKDLVAVVRLITDVDKVADFRRVDLCVRR